jgi:hypothetical protein
MKLCPPPLLSRSFLVLQGLSYCSESLLVLTLPRERFREPGQAVLKKPNSSRQGEPVM